MSGGGLIGLQIRCLSILIKSIIDLGLEYKKLSSIKTADGITHKVELLLEDENGKAVGFEKTKNGDYCIVSDSSGLNSGELKKQESFTKRIRQKYAYNMVMQELKKQGYIISEEEKVQNNTIRLVARKWS